jgi:uncharacterized repeat protein (TIGR01451 family)
MVTWELGTMMPGDVVVGTLVLEAMEAGSWTNEVEVTCAEGVTDMDDATTEVVLPTIAIMKDGPSEIYVFSNATYTITVENTGMYDATDVVVTDTIPADMSYVSSSPSGTVDGSVVTWSLGTMMPGDMHEITLVLNGALPGTYTNLVDVTCAEGVTDMDDATTIVLEGVAFEIDMIDTIDPIVVGGTTTYIVNATNEGSVIAYNVLITVQIPEKTSFVSASGPVSYTYAAGLVTFDPITSLDVGNSVFFNVVVEADASGYVLAEASITADDYPQIVKVQEGTTIYGSASSMMILQNLGNLVLLSIFGPLSAIAGYTFISRRKKKIL